MATRESEARILALRDAGDLEAAVTLALEVHGPEVAGYLRALARDETLADDCFQRFAEDLWRGLASFRGESSLRTWVYSLAHHALCRQLRGERRAKRGWVALESSDISRLVHRERSATAPWARTGPKSWLARLRDELPQEDRALLVLRVDRRLGWDEIAAVLAVGGAAPRPDVAALRKRFQRLKERVRARARAEGVTEDGGG